MTIEHERKFVVRDANFVRRIGHEAHGERLAQGYLVERDGTSVRVRILANKTGLLTYKGRRKATSESSWKTTSPRNWPRRC